MKKVYVVGAGPAGLMAAISAKTHYPNFEVTILERNDVIGKKLRLTGGGRCNVTCNIPIEEFIEYTPKNPKFIYSTLQNFNAKHIMDFFKQAGCTLKQEDHNRMFPKSNKSIDIVNTLMKKLQELKIKVEYGVLVHEVKNDVKTLLTSKGEFKYDYLIIATGGKTYPHTGSDGTGYDLAKQLGHTITPLIPAEVPLVSNDPVIQSKALQGLSFKDVSLTVGKKRLIHDLIFTHFGISGPVALRASYYVQELLKKNKDVVIEIDFLPNIIKEDLYNLSNQALNKLLPKRLIAYFESISKNEDEFFNNIKSFPLTVYETCGFKMAFLTNGGISTKEINPKTMKSKLDSNVSFCGEIIDVNSFTGGLNITFAFSTGFTAGKYLIE